MSENSDVKLVPGQVVVDAYDLCLQSSDTDRNHGGGEHRRALVHDFDDGLTINWDNDYPGGLTLKGVKSVEGQPTATAEGHNIPVKSSLEVKGRLDCRSMLRIIGTGVWTQFRYDDENRLVVEQMGPAPSRMTFNGPLQFEGQVSLSKFVGRAGIGAVVEIPDLVAELVNLRNEIGKLKANISKLEQQLSNT